MQSAKRGARREASRGPTRAAGGRDDPGPPQALPLEAPLMRLVAAGGIIGIGVVIAAIMTSQDSRRWLIGLVVSIVSVVLAAIVWSSPRL
jgi:hypothetical protein